MDLCRDCREFAIAISKRTKFWSRPHAFWNEASLQSDNCRLCKMISEYILDNATEPISTLNESVKLSYSSFEDIMAPRPLSCVRFQTKSNYQIEMNVWSDPGSPASLSGTVCDKPPLQSDDGSAAFAHINSWIQQCLQNHRDCDFTMSNRIVNDIDGPELPTRVLDLGLADDTDLSLIETRNEKGKYCALSYCWGALSGNHLLTTKANIKSHFDSIKFDQLPKTLQDAVTVTRKIGIRYLWIDSLCIIQEDTTDWTTESAKMAEVYQNAYLVIAASGAAHPGEGCFSEKRRCSTSIEIPHFSEALQVMGSIRLSMRLSGDDNPAWGPLRERGWALQERRLARRMLQFMPAGISWKCRELETGERYPYDMFEYSDWQSVLDDFSVCELTYKEDRLVALKGFGEALQEASGDKYAFGMFESKLPGLLLWVVMGDEVDTSEDLVSVPTWSWASKGGPKIFWSPVLEVLGRDLINRSELTIEISGTLRIKGVLQEYKVSKTEIDEPEFATLHSMLCFYFDDRKTLYLFERASASSGVLGIAAFDREHCETVNVLFLNELQHNDGIEPEQVRLVNFQVIKTSNDKLAKNIGAEGTLLT